MDGCVNAACGHEVPSNVDRCPHCGEALDAPNVRTARHPREKAALEQRYRRAREDLSARGSSATADAFERALAGSSAVIMRSLGEIERLTGSEHELYSTYYKLLDAGQRSLDRGWGMRRVLAEEVLFHGYKQEIRFAMLTLDGRGSSKYGEYGIVLASAMIAARATVFEENGVVFMMKLDPTFMQMTRGDIPQGHRATWNDRAMLCVAKLAPWLTADTDPAAFASLLLRPGASLEGDDDFVEVHVYGPLSVRSIAKIVQLGPDRSDAEGIKRRAWQEKLSSSGVPLEVV